MNARIPSQLKDLANINHLEPSETLDLRRKAYRLQRIAMLYITDIKDEHDRQTVERITKEQLYGERK